MNLGEAIYASPKRTILCEFAINESDHGLLGVNSNRTTVGEGRGWGEEDV